MKSFEELPKGFHGKNISPGK